MKIIQTMGSYGWTLYSATNVDSLTYTLFFCRMSNLYISPAFTETIFAISLNREDRIRSAMLDFSGAPIFESIKTSGESAYNFRAWSQLLFRLSIRNQQSICARGVFFLQTKFDFLTFYIVQKMLLS